MTDKFVAWMVAAGIHDGPSERELAHRRALREAPPPPPSPSPIERLVSAVRCRLAMPPRAISPGCCPA